MSAGKMTAGRPGDRGPVQGFFVTGTGTDVGKTAFTAALLRALRGRGVAAQALKPVQTGVRPEQLATSALADGVAYARAVADLPPLPPAPAATLHCFLLPASPHLAAGEEGQRLTVAGLAEDVRAHWQETETSLLLVEGAGGMAVPINEEEDTLDFMAALDLPVLLVGSNCLGALNHVLLSLQALRLKGLRPAAVVCVDSLCSAEGQRLGRTVQFSDTGLYPAQADHTRHLTRDTVGVPVVAAGIPTLMQAQEGADLVVTPRALDSVIAHGAALLACAVNRALQPRLTVQQLCWLTG